MNDNDASGFAAFMGDVLSQCLERWMQLPWLMSLVSMNGSMMGRRIAANEAADALEAEVLAEHTVGDMMQLPINIMIVDADGPAARVLVDTTGITFH